MTFSLIARSADGAAWGVAVASKFLAAGAVVPAARAGQGAVATQSFVNLRYLPDGLALLAAGRDAAGVVAALTGPDELREQRQVGVVGSTGDGAAFTGADCIPWAGSRSGDGWSAQGNCLAGPEVLEQMATAFLASGECEPLGARSLGTRLLAGLRAADAAGGDRRGRQSAALLVVTEGGGYGGGSDVLVDLRVDDHAAPVDELVRLLDLHDLYFGTPDPADLRPLEGELAREVDAALRSLGHDGAAGLDERLFDWMGWENYEERHVPGAIDPVVLAQLRAAVRP